MTASLALLKENFTRDGILMCFNGPFSHEIIEELGSAIKAHLQQQQVTHTALMDLFAIFIEQTQNIRNYTQRMPLHGHDPAALQSAIVLIGKQQEKYWVHSGNYVAREDVPALLEKISRLNHLSPHEIKGLYRSTLRQEVPPSATGAGLGLIDMARRMSEPFRASTEEVDADFAFFSLRVTI